jgi:CheY-like chemotaxis protein
MRSSIHPAKVQNIRQFKVRTYSTVTAFARDEDGVRCRNAGFKTHLTKPVVPFDLIDAIETIVSDLQQI